MVRSPRPGIRPNFVRSIMSIRPFEAKDLPKVISLVEGIFNEAYDPNLYLQMSKDWPGGLVVAELGTDLVGFLMAMVQRPFQTRVLILCVKEGLRGLGVGKALMHAIMNRSIMKGNRRMTLEVRTTNETAQAFYAKLGFEMIGLIPRFYSNGDSAFLLKKMFK